MFNQLIIAGRLTRSPELSFTPNTGSAVCKFTLAVDRGDSKKTTDFFDCVVWNKLGEAVAQHLDKGSACILSGKMTFRTYEAKDGTKRKVSEVVANSVQFLTPKGDSKQEQYPDGGRNLGSVVGKDDEEENDCPF